jgi:hypothetical protein
MVHLPCVAVIMIWNIGFATWFLDVRVVMINLKLAAIINLGEIWVEYKN